MPEPDYPMEFHIATVREKYALDGGFWKFTFLNFQVISEDMDDNSHDDCTVQVLQYR